MANTYSQLYIHFVFAVQNRISLIQEAWRIELYKYINGIIEQQGHKSFALSGVEDHIHVLVSMNPKQAQSELMFHVKRSSTLWINSNKFVQGKFSWQEGFGSFSYGKSQIPDVCKYIDNQQKHHKRISFQEEYLAFLKAFEVDFDERYIFKPIEN